MDKNINNVNEEGNNCQNIDNKGKFWYNKV